MFDHVTVKLKKKNPRAEFGVINLSQALRPGPQSPVAAPPPGWHVCGIEMCEAFCPACSRELFSALRRGRKGESRNQSPVPGVWTYTVIRVFFNFFTGCFRCFVSSLWWVTPDLSRLSNQSKCEVRISGLIVKGGNFRVRMKSALVTGHCWGQTLVESTQVRCGFKVSPQTCNSENSTFSINETAFIYSWHQYFCTIFKI